MPFGNKFSPFSKLKKDSSSSQTEINTNSANTPSNSSSLTLPSKYGHNTSSLVTLKTSLMGEVSVEELLKRKGYEPIRIIGEGGFARVYCVREISNDSGQSSSENLFASKVFDLTNSSNKVWVQKCLKNEMYISKQLKHPNIVMTYKVFKTRLVGVIIMQYASNGNIKTDIYQRLRKPYSEDDARKYFSGLMCGLNHMHKSNITHRDLKLDNFLLSSNNVPMISDFGFAAFSVYKKFSMVLDSLMRSTRCGTCGYMAPELYKASESQQYDAKAADIFAMGVSLFEMLNMELPFPSEDIDQIIQKIVAQEINFRQKVSNSCREIILKMLHILPPERPKADQVLQNGWVKNSLLNMLVNKLT